MSEGIRQKAGLIYNVIESTLVTLMVGGMCWLGQMGIAHSNALAAHRAELQSTAYRLDRLESRGSPGLAAHETQDDQRIGELRLRMEKVETAIIGLQAAPGELKAINARLDALSKSTDRIEAALRDHVEKKL